MNKPAVKTTNKEKSEIRKTIFPRIPIVIFLTPSVIMYSVSCVFLDCTLKIFWDMIFEKRFDEIKADLVARKRKYRCVKYIERMVLPISKQTAATARITTW
jgi:hypothetical protein